MKTEEDYGSRYHGEYNANMDLIKMISMICIVITHGLSYGHYEPQVIPDIIGKSSIIADNLFIVVSGYLYGRRKHKSINFGKIGKIWMKADLYSWLIFGILFMTGKVSVSRNILYDMFPVLTGGYWFLTVYLLLCLVMPFLDFVSDSLSQPQLKWLIIILLFAFSVFSSFPYTLEIGAYHGYSLPWFAILYLAGKYLAVNKCLWGRERRGKLFYLIVLCMIWAEKVALSFFPSSYKGLQFKVNDVNNLLWFLASLCIFHLLEDLKIHKKLTGIVRTCGGGISGDLCVAYAEFP